MTLNPKTIKILSKLSALENGNKSSIEFLVENVLKNSIKN